MPFGRVHYVRLGLVETEIKPFQYVAHDLERFLYIPSTLQKSASNIGSMMSLAAICATRSRIVGIPSGRKLPSALGIMTRRTGLGR